MIDSRTWRSEIDEQLAVPGRDRTRLAQTLAAESAASERPAFDTATWKQVAALDDGDGFGTRHAARAVLTRPSDGRFLIFRYPFRDGTSRFVIPGGGAKPGEDARAAVEREVFEETGTHARDLRPSGLFVFHLLASTIYGSTRTPTIQYSPVLLGMVDDELPDTGGREVHWFSIEEFQARPRRPISDPLLSILHANDDDGVIDPIAVWLPA